uniref:Uncharacterized protein n=1 Tax=Fagus sylvatica TaxID=28930 RepID=A0A2N9G2J3_FAGSY
MPPANRELPRCSRSHYLSNAPGLADQLVASRKDSAREGGSGLAEIRAWTCEIYGPREQRATGVFLVRLRAVFRSGFRLDRINSWRSESSTSCMTRPLSNVPGLADQLVASQEDSARKHVAPDVGFRRSWYRRKACATYFQRYKALHRGELGFARYDLANRGRWNVPHAKGSFSDRDSGLTGGALDDPRSCGL